MYGERRGEERRGEVHYWVLVVRLERKRPLGGPRSKSEKGCLRSGMGRHGLDRSGSG
jgi:hypothetical protein